MVSLIRKYQQSAMIIVTFLIIVAFVAYWNGPTGARNRMPSASDDVGKMNGNAVTLTTLRREVEKAKLGERTEARSCPRTSGRGAHPGRGGERFRMEQPRPAT